MAIEAPTRPASIAAQEAPQGEKPPTFGEYFAALHTRILLGGMAFNPTAELPEVTKSALIQRNLETRDYMAFENGSREQRKAHWGEGNFDEQKAAWLEDIVSKFNSEQARKFFAGAQGQQWAKVFSGLGINATEFNEDKARQLYEKYLSGTAADQKSKQFIKDILSDPELNVEDPQTLNAISWIGNIFGNTSKSPEEIKAQIANAADVMVNCVYAEKQFIDNPDAIVGLANEIHRVPIDNQGNTTDKPRRNVFSSDEEVRRLNFLWRGLQTQPETTQPATPTSPTQPTGPEPTPQTQEEPAQPQEIVPGVNLKENIRAAEQFIRILRDPTKFTDIPGETDKKMHEFGFKLKLPLEESWFYVNDTLDMASNRYKMPMALYVPGNHAMLALKAPEETADGTWKMLVYNPFNAGEEEIILPTYDPSNPLGSHIHTNRLSNAQFQDGSYDLSISNNSELVKYQKEFTEGKLAALQKDGKNCLPYTLFVATLLNGLKPGETDFKRDGIPQFREDFNIRIKTLEEMLSGN